jgi:Tfp pilus assembly PilM family ATPase
MASQLALDFSRHRLRAVEIDGHAKSPKIKSFVAGDVAPPPAPAPGEGQGAGQVAPQWRYSDAAKALFEQRRLVRDPAAIALSSIDCTFRDLELPFSGADQIDKVIKFEAENQLQLVDIDSVVVTYHLLDADGRGGSRLLVAACTKEQIGHVLADLAPVGVDPHFADLHLCALYTALKFTGYFAPPEGPAADAPPDTVVEGETLLAIECDHDVTHLLVARGDQLVGARAIRLGLASRTVAPAGEAEAAPEPAEQEAHDDGESFVVVDDIGDEAPALGHGRRVPSDYFERLRREIQRTLFKLGPTGDRVKRVLLLGPASASEAFRAHLEQDLRMPVEAAKVFDRVDHNLDEEELKHANAEGTAALGVALRLVGYDGGSRVDFRQEQVRYARRFDQVKVALSCLAIAAFVLVALACIERGKQMNVKTESLRQGIYAILNDYEPYAENENLRDRVNKGQLTYAQAADTARRELFERRKKLGIELGRSKEIPRLASGLDYLNAVVAFIDKQRAKIGRIEITLVDLDVSRDRTSLKLKGHLNEASAVDAFVAAIRASPAVKSVKEPQTTGISDGRLEFSGLEVELLSEFDPRAAVAKKEPTR